MPDNKPFSLVIRQRFTAWFVLIFYLLAAMQWLTGMWLYQMEPVFFNTRFDGVTWLFITTGLHKWLMQYHAAQVLMDVLFYCWPLLYFLLWQRGKWYCVGTGLIWFLINWVYVQCYTLYPTNSIEAHIAWLLFPIVFSFTSVQSFSYGVAALRYFFLYFFVSAAVWKLLQGGLFFPEQMTGILLEQHKEFLLTNGEHWQSNFIYFIARNSWLGFALYWMAALLEFCFVIGFFTHRFDAWLIRATILFLVVDVLVMRIPYFSILPFVLCLAFSRYTGDNGNSIKSSR